MQLHSRRNVASRRASAACFLPTTTPVQHGSCPCPDVQDLGGVEVLSLDGCKPGSAASNISMCDPSLLDLGIAALSSSDFGALNRLAYLEWHVAQNIMSLPSTLATLDLSNSRSMTALPDLGALTGLQQLDLSHCASLARLPESLSALTGLHQLDLSKCRVLAALPESLGALTGLQQLVLSHCESLARLPESLGVLTKLQQLDISYCEGLVALPGSLGTLTGLQQLDICECFSLTALPESLGMLTKLQQLDLIYLEALVVLPESLGALTGLQRLGLSQCVSLVALPKTLGRLDRVAGAGPQYMSVSSHSARVAGRADKAAAAAP